MKATPEQKIIIDYISENDGLVMSSAVAGSGKTTLLVAIANTLAKKNNAKSGLYLAYNKAIATEAQKRFPSYVKCCTTHSLAYKPTVIEHNLKLGFFNYRSILESIKYDRKCAIVDYIKEFCLSEYTSFDNFAEAMNIPQATVTLANKYLNLMESGKIECNHEFYLKMFHIMLANNIIEFDEFDFIALDEAGDLNPVTLEIFNLLPAKKKIMVGDKLQNIYAFNHTINCFEVMKDHGITFPMSQSFRVNKKIAKRIEKFCQKYLDPNMSFKGVKIEDKSIDTRAFISRTNSALIGKMIELNEQSIPYGLTRTPKQIFALPLALCNLRLGGFIPLPEYKHLQDDVNEFYQSRDLMENHRSVLAYLRFKHDDDLALQNAINVIIRYGKSAIINCYNEASKHTKANQFYTLGTAHSTKGLEFDSVTLADDTNSAISPILNLLNNGVELDALSDEVRSELNLYYVACSRAKKELNNAVHLPVNL